MCFFYALSQDTFQCIPHSTKEKTATTMWRTSLKCSLQTQRERTRNAMEETEERF
jgi:hypothetical protein